MEYLRNDNILTISTSYSSDGVCTCGEKNFGYDDGLWCCKSSQGYCTTDKTYGADRNIGMYARNISIFGLYPLICI